MKQFRIIKVEMLNDHSAVLITVQGVAEKIYRTSAQFLAELKGSNLIQSGVTLNSPVIPVVLRGLSGGIVYGNVDYHKAGTTYVIEAEHPALTDSNHRLYGSVVEGDKVEREKSGFYVERGNLLSFKATAAFENRMDTIVLQEATRVAMETESLSYMDLGSSNAPVQATPSDAFDTIEDDIIADAPVIEEPVLETTESGRGKAKGK